MVSSWIPTFLTPCSFQSFFSKTCVCKFWMVRSWAPIFLTRHFPFKVVFPKAPRMNFGRIDLEEGAGGTINTLLIPSILLNLSFHGSRAYSDYCFAQLSWHRTRENERWMVDLGFLLFSSPFRFMAFFFNHLQLWTLDGKILASFFSHPMFLSKFLFKNLRLQILDGKLLDSHFSHAQFSFLKSSFKKLRGWTLHG